MNSRDSRTSHLGYDKKFVNLYQSIGHSPKIPISTNANCIAVRSKCPYCRTKRRLQYGLTCRPYKYRTQSLPLIYFKLFVLYVSK